MKSGIVVLFILIASAAGAQNARMNGFVLNQTFATLQTDLVELVATETVTITQQQIINTQVGKDLNTTAADILAPVDPNISNIVVQEDLVAGRIGSEKGIFSKFFSKLKTIRLFSCEENPVL